MNKGTAMLTKACSENAGVVHTGLASAKWNDSKCSWPSAPASATPTSSTPGTA